MLKIFGYGDKIRNNIQDDSIELLDKRDYRTPYDINRPIINLYDDLENIYLFLNSFGIYQLTDEGVFRDSLKHAFEVREQDVKKITLKDTRDSTNIITVDKVYARLSPGVAGVYYDDSNRQNSSLVVNKPNIRLFERQVSEILGLFYHNEEEQVKVKYNNNTQTFKALIKKQLDPTENISSFYFGCVDQTSFDNDGIIGLSSQELIAEMFNHQDLNNYFVSAIGFEIEQLQLEKLFPIISTGIKYWNIINGQIVLNDSNDGFFLGSFNITSLDPVNITSINNNKILYGEKVRIDIHGTADDSYQLNSQGGAEFNIFKDFKIKNIQGTEVKINETGSIEVNGAKDVNINFSDNFNIQNIISQFLIDTDGKLTVRVSEEDVINTGDKTETIQGNSTINIDGNNNEIINGDEIKNISGDLSLTINNSNETVHGDKTETVQGNSTINIDGNNNETVNGNEIKNISGNSTEVVINNKVVTAKKQTFNCQETLFFVSPSIVFDSGSDGTISFIVSNQIIEGDTVRLGDNLIELNKNQTGIPSEGIVSGFEINRGSLTNAQIIFRESDDSWVSGLVGSLKVIANREEDSNIVNFGIPSWDSTDKIFKTDSKFLYNKTTGTITVNTNSAPPIQTNSSLKINNMNVDKVDGIDIDNTDVSSGEIVIWTSENVISTSNKVFSTDSSLSSNSDNNIPTEKAVKSYVDSEITELNNAITGSPTFNDLVTIPTLKLTDDGDGADTNNVFIRDSLSKLKTREIHPAVWSTDDESFRSGIGLGPTASPTFNDLQLNGQLTSSVLKTSDIENTNGTFYNGTTAPTGISRLNFSGYFYATRIYGSVYNDIADFVEVPDDFEIEYGKVYFRNSKNEIIKTNKKGQSTSLGIASDTFGFGIGARDEKVKTMPIAIGGWVLAYVDKEYPSGTKLIANKNGTLTKAKFFNRNIIAIYDRPEKKEKWKDVIVNKRHWVKVV